MPTESRAPSLLPQNRKLRHLQGIWLRNLSFARPKARAADDVDLNTSHAKTDKLREKSSLHHALSSESLRPKARRRTTTLSQESPVSEQKKLEALYNSLVADAFFSLHCEGEDEPIYVSEKLDRKTVGALNTPLSYHDRCTSCPRTNTLSRRISTSCPLTSTTTVAPSLDHPSLRSGFGSDALLAQRNGLYTRKRKLICAD